MSEIWYKTCRLYGGEIDAVDVDKSTTISVWVKGRRIKKIATYERYFPTWDEAKSYLMDASEKEVKQLRCRLDKAIGDAGNIRGLKKPEGAK